MVLGDGVEISNTFTENQCNFMFLNRSYFDFCQASDMVSTSRILVAVVQMCYEAKDWDALNENIMLLTKRRSQLKQVGYKIFVMDLF